MADHADATDPQAPESHDTLVELLAKKVVGQPAAMQYIVPYLQMYQAGLAPPDRPAGIFLLLAPTSTGKTRTVEALAEVLHGPAKAVLTVACGEFQSDHEAAKWIGAPRPRVARQDPRSSHRRAAAPRLRPARRSIV